MTCASTANLETCAAKTCAQPVTRELGHLVPSAEGDARVAIGYCDRHADRILNRRMQELTR